MKTLFNRIAHRDVSGTPLAKLVLIAIAFSLLRTPVSAQSTRLIPPPGMAIPDTDRASLEAELASLKAAIADIKTRDTIDDYGHDLLPDVLIFEKAVSWSLRDNTIYNAGQIGDAHELLREGLKRAQQLKAGKPAWLKQTGLVVRGYRSKIDGSIQPYGLVVPAKWNGTRSEKHRLDLFLHGRGEQLTELAFVHEHLHSEGEFTPPGAFVLLPYGRFCNANHFAGETDVWEAIDSVERWYPIDRDRIVLRGFSMGGASVWHLATHFSDFWAAVAPGAGFSETAQFTGIKTGNNPPPWYVQTLWHLYDATDYAVNLAQCSTVAYNGDKDGQKQAADRMEDALRAEGISLTRVIGKNAGHWYTADGKAEINKFVDTAVALGRERYETVRFSTWTLKYNRQNWITVDALGQHWQRATVTAKHDPNGLVTVQTTNVNGLTIALPKMIRTIRIDNQEFVVNAKGFPVNRRPTADFHLTKAKSGKWQIIGRGKSAEKAKPETAKRHNLQGPIDDAFMDSFVFVRPTGIPINPATGAWATAAQAAAAANWHRALRGDVVTMDDTAVTDDTIQHGNLVLWGDPQSNALLKRLLPRLPIRWNRYGLVVNGKRYASSRAVPVLIFPNPLNPNRYVVLNSGFTWYRYASDNNALMTPWLPDWAVLPIADPNAQPLDAGFFDEQWSFQPQEKVATK